MSKTFSLTGYLEWAKVFPETMDDYKEHMKKSQGAFTANFFLENEEDMERMLNAGVPESQLGHPTFRSKPDGYGTGFFLKLKRPNKGPFIDDDGVDVFGGPPVIYDHTNGPSSEIWDYEKGDLGNGTKVIVLVDFWQSKGGGKGLRLKEMAVLEHVEYEAPEC